MASPKEPTTPAPVIGKIGPYTVFLTPPPATPKPPETPTVTKTPKKAAVVHTPPPVRPPPVQFDKPTAYRFGFLRHAFSKVQNVHASIDEFMANWLGLDQSKFQWALDDFYEAKEVEKGDVKTKGVSGKSQTV